MSTTTNTYINSNQTQKVKPASEEPDFTEQASNFLTSATAAVSSYLPASVSNAVAGVTGATTTDSTTAYRNRQPHVGGVGDLGTQEEQDVVRVPEERQNPDPLSGNTTTANIGTPNPAFNEPTGIQEQNNNRGPGEIVPQSNSGVSAGITGVQQTNMTGMTATSGMGITGVGGHPGQPGGVGDLGTPSTSDVAVLPEERETSGAAGKTRSFGVGGHPGYPGGASDLGTHSANGVAILPDERASTNIKGTSSSYDSAEAACVGKDNQDIGLSNGGLGGHEGRHHDITKAGSTGGHTGANYDVDHGLGMPHTRSTMVPPTSSNSKEKSPADERTSAGGDYRTTSQQQDHGHDEPSKTPRKDDQDESDKNIPSPKEADYPTGKPTMMDKIKGHILVAKAKVTGHDD